MSKYDFSVEGVSLEAVFNKLGGVRGAKRFLADELLLVEASKPVPIPEPPLDFIIRVDRSVKPTYPEWMKKLILPELECAVPAEYDLSTVSQWLHDAQKNGVVVGNTIYNDLQKGDAFATCLNLQDGLAIQAKGMAVFRKLFAGKAVFLWGSVARDQSDNLFVPFLYENDGEVVVFWNWVSHLWRSCDPALRFKK